MQFYCQYSKRENTNGEYRTEAVHYHHGNITVILKRIHNKSKIIFDLLYQTYPRDDVT